MNSNAQDGTADGYTLLEMIVAFLVLSISMAVAVQTINIASRSIALASEKAAVIEVLNILKAEKLPVILTAGKSSDAGDTNGMRWEVDFTPTKSAESSKRKQGLALIRIYPVKGADRHHEFIVFEFGAR